MKNRKKKNPTLARIILVAKAAALVGLVTGGIAADHAVENFWATYDVRAVEKTSWAEYQGYQTLKAQKVEQAAAHATTPAPDKKNKKQHVSAIPAPPTPAKFAQADSIGIFITGKGR